MSTLRELASFVRWRLVPVRYATRLGNIRPSRIRVLPPVRTVVSEAVGRIGYHPGPTISPEEVAAINAIYKPRIAEVVERPRGHPFVNLIRADDISSDNPVMRFAFSSRVLDAASDYFSGACTLDSIQVLYSWPTEGSLRESQKWHKDYGDSKSFHCIVYLNDVLGLDDGPFVFVDKANTRRISKAPIIRRIDDDRFARELGDGEIQRFYGKAGNSIFVDPAACYHYGSRCRNARLAIFVTFNSRFPFVAPQPFVMDNAARLYETAHAVRPDLGEAFLRELLQLRA